MLIGLEAAVPGIPLFAILFIDGLSRNKIWHSLKVADVADWQEILTLLVIAATLFFAVS
jgi:hypothetical protein